MAFARFGISFDFIKKSPFSFDKCAEGHADGNGILDCTHCGPTFARRELGWSATEVYTKLSDWERNYTTGSVEALKESSERYCDIINNAVQLRTLKYNGLVYLHAPPCWGTHDPKNCQDCQTYVAWMEVRAKIDQAFIQSINELVTDMPVEENPEPDLLPPAERERVMDFSKIVKLRAVRMAGIKYSKACVNATPHNREECAECAAIDAEEFLRLAVEADFQKQVAAASKETPAYNGEKQHRAVASGLRYSDVNPTVNKKGV